MGIFDIVSIFMRISTEWTDGDRRKDDLLDGYLEDRGWGQGVGPVSAHKECHEERQDEAECHNQKPEEIEDTSITPSKNVRLDFMTLWEREFPILDLT